jgi:hypothetical protein
MKPQRNRILSVSLVLLLATAVLFVFVPSALAHDPPWTIPRYAYVTVAPNPVGVNQPVAIVIWTNVPPPTANGVRGDRWTGYTVDVTKPDGTVIHVLSNGASDPVGSSYALYTPDVIGTYSVKFSFPDQVAELAGYTGIPGTNSQYVGDLFLGASANTTFTVSQTTVAYFQEAQFPVSYWTRPINENNQDWSAIGSAWLGNQLYGATYLKYNPYGWAPNTAHVSMTYPLSWGGIVGGNNAANDHMSFYSGTQYQLKFSYPIIMYGNVYFSLPVNNAPSGNGVTCVDLRTGQTKWTNTEINSFMFGQLLDVETPNQHGTTGIYLWARGTAVGTGITNPGAEAVDALSGTYPPGTNLGEIRASTDRTADVSASAWIAVDPQTGKVLFNQTNVPSGTTAYGPLGEWLVYNIGRENSSAPYTYLYQWNNSKLPGNDVVGGITGWSPGNNNWNMSASYDWNVTLSEALDYTYSPIGSGNPDANGLLKLSPQIMQVAPGDWIFGQSSGLQTTPGTSRAVLGTPDPFTLWAINLNATRGPIGQVMWIKNYPAPAGNITVNLGPADPESNVFTLYYKETIQWLGFDMLTGNQIWGPTEPQNSWNYYTGSTALTNPVGVGYGHLYTAGYSGILYAYDMKTGHLDFTFGNDINDPNNSTYTAETVYGEYPTQVAAIANNKVYLVEEEHSLNAPAYHGAKTRCVDAFTGKLIWDIYGISSWQMSAAADGYYTWLNLNDMQVYAMGPGPSATTVTTSPAVVSRGNAVEIMGTVTDQTPQAQLKGTPAISDADQGKQMEFLIQHSIDQPDVQGVPVKLTAIDQSGQTMDLGTVFSDGNGLFHHLWMPPAEGEYTVIANFTGSQAYGPSSAATAVGVTAAVSPVVTPTPTPTSTTPVETASPTVAPTESTSPAVSPTTAPPPGGLPMSTIYAIAAAVIIIAVIAVAAVALRRRK